MLEALPPAPGKAAERPAWRAYHPANSLQLSTTSGCGSLGSSCRKPSGLSRRSHRPGRSWVPCSLGASAATQGHLLLQGPRVKTSPGPGAHRGGRTQLHPRPSALVRPRPAGGQAPARAHIWLKGMAETSFGRRQRLSPQPVCCPSSQGCQHTWPSRVGDGLGACTAPAGNSLHTQLAQGPGCQPPAHIHHRFN